MSGAHQVLIVAAEASSALYAKRLLEIWKSQEKNVSAFGVGSREMQDLGFEILGRSEEMSILGLQEVLKHYFELKKVFDNLIEEAKKRQPDFILLMDYSGFNLRLARELKKLNFKIIYFISPQVWAWRKKRIHTIREVVDKMLVILPFEKKFYDEYSVPCEFVGHPLLDEIDADLFNSSSRDFNRKKFGVQGNQFLLGLMPGSRYSELKFNLKSQAEAARLLLKKYPQIKVAFLVAPTFSIEDFKKHIPTDLDIPYILMKDESTKMVSFCDIILCASGTATLVVGLLEKPMVIMYKVNALTAFIGRRLVQVSHFGLINLILGQRVVPELFQEAATPEALANELEKFISDEGYYLSVKKKLAEAKNLLGRSGAVQRVADLLESYFRVGDNKRAK